MSVSPSVTRIRVRSAGDLQGRWMLLPASATVVRDVLHAILANLGLPKETEHFADLLLHGSPLLLNENVAVIRDGDTLELKTRSARTKSRAYGTKRNDMSEPTMANMLSPTRGVAKKRTNSLVFKFSPKPHPTGSAQRGSINMVSRLTARAFATRPPLADVPFTSASRPPSAGAASTSEIPAVERRLRFAPASGSRTTINPPKDDDIPRNNSAQSPKPPSVFANHLETKKDARSLREPRPANENDHVFDATFVKEKGLLVKPTAHVVVSEPIFVDYKDVVQEEAENKHVSTQLHRESSSRVLRKRRRGTLVIDEPSFNDDTTTEPEQRCIGAHQRKAQTGYCSSVCERTATKELAPLCNSPPYDVSRIQGSTPGLTGPSRRLAAMNREGISSAMAISSIDPVLGECGHGKAPLADAQQADMQSSEKRSVASEEQTKTMQLEYSQKRLKSLSGCGPSRIEVTKRNADRIADHGLRAPTQAGNVIALQTHTAPLSSALNAAPTTGHEIGIGKTQLEQTIRFVEVSDDNSPDHPESENKELSDIKHLSDSRVPVPGPLQERMDDAKLSDRRIKGPSVIPTPVQVHSQDVGTHPNKNVNFDLLSAKEFKASRTCTRIDPVPTSLSEDRSSPESIDAPFANPFLLVPRAEKLEARNRSLCKKSDELLEDDYSDKETTGYGKRPLKFVMCSSEAEEVLTGEVQSANSPVVETAFHKATPQGRLEIERHISPDPASNAPALSVNERREQELVSAPNTGPSRPQATEPEGDQTSVKSAPKQEGGTCLALTKEQTMSPEAEVNEAAGSRTPETPRSFDVQPMNKQVRKGGPKSEGGELVFSASQRKDTLAADGLVISNTKTGAATDLLKTRGKRKRYLSVEGKRKRNARNRRREQRKRREARERSIENGDIDETRTALSRKHKKCTTSTGSPASVPVCPEMHDNAVLQAEDQIVMRVDKDAPTFCGLPDTDRLTGGSARDMEQGIDDAKVSAIKEVEGRTNRKGSIHEHPTYHECDKVEGKPSHVCVAKISPPSCGTDHKKSRKSPSRSKQGCVAAALRLARSHGFLDNCSKEQPSPNDARKTVVAEAKAPIGEISDVPAEEELSTVTFISGAHIQRPTKKRKLSKRARMYMDEEQYNESCFVGFESSGGIPLPSPNLLTLFDYPKDAITQEELTIPKQFLSKELAVGSVESKVVKARDDSKSSRVQAVLTEAVSEVQLRKQEMARCSKERVPKETSIHTDPSSKKLSSKDPNIQKLETREESPNSRGKVVLGRVSVCRTDVASMGVLTDSAQVRTKDPSAAYCGKPRMKARPEKRDKGHVVPHNLDATVLLKETQRTRSEATTQLQGEASIRVRNTQRSSLLPVPSKSQLKSSKSKPLRLPITSRLMELPRSCSANPKGREWNSEYLTTPAGKVLNTSPFSDRNETGASATGEDSVFSNAGHFKTSIKNSSRMGQDKSRHRPRDTGMISKLPQENSEHMAVMKEIPRKAPGINNVSKVPIKEKVEAAKATGPSLLTKAAHLRSPSHSNPKSFPRVHLRSAPIDRTTDRQSPSSSRQVQRNVHSGKQDKGHLPAPGGGLNEDSYCAILLRTVYETTKAIKRFSDRRYAN